MRILTDREWTVAELLAELSEADADAKVSFGKVRKADQRNECWCGCGGETRGKFVPGHDSKFHSLAKRVARGQAEMPTEFVNADAEADFMKWHDREVPVWEAKQEAERVKANAKAAAKAEKAETEQPKAEIKAMEPVAEGEELDDLLSEVTMS